MNSSFALFYFSSIPYSYLLQRPQQLFHAFQKLYPELDVYYVEPPCGIRSYLKRKKQAAPGVLNRVINIPSNYYLPGVLRFNRWALEHVISARALNGKKLVAIACASLWEPLLSHEFFDLITYDCLDAIDVHAANGNYVELAHKHESLVNKANIVFATAAKLREDILRTFPEKPVVVVSNGVDSDFFAERCCRNIRFPVVSGKVVGYVGAVRDWIDIDLLAETARMMPHITFVIVGPIEIKCQAAMKMCPDNIVFVGEQPYVDVPAWIARFDVALIPFRQSAIAEATNPIKLYEYFQLGKPVVATPMRELSRYCDAGLLYFADNAKGFSEAISLALGSGMVESEQRKEIAGMNSWQSKARIMMEQITPLIHLAAE